VGSNPAAPTKSANERNGLGGDGLSPPGLALPEQARETAPNREQVPAGVPAARSSAVLLLAWQGERLLNGETAVARVYGSATGWMAALLPDHVGWYAGPFGNQREAMRAAEAEASRRSGYGLPRVSTDGAMGVV
jgi:hypothetical protein